ncbi:hypothetical protein [Mesomycoplasma molare]|uniref:DNA polymerase III subunit delta n=1 Tax=Mesomycoplasma molare TaxID=171288 RepID=A0ABY5TTE2_9BACT|nr:hypothetical protein [Mesomycoplasma molare]UWD33933.1 hypothetical protein NX772_02365 [Mesomycoplasma molare]
MKKSKKIIDNFFEKNIFFHSIIISASNKNLIQEMINYIFKKFKDKNIENKIISFSKDEIEKEKLKDALRILSNNTSEKTILLLNDIENYHNTIANSLLKFLEEPNDSSLIIMTTLNDKNILKTIKSRSIVLKIFNNSEEVMKENLKNIYINYSTLIEKYKEIINNKKVFDYFIFLFNNWNKDNNDFILDLLLETIKNILYFDEKNIFFTKMEIKKANKMFNLDTDNSLKIIEEIFELKKKEKYFINFELQKTNFLIRLKGIILKNV